MLESRSGIESIDLEMPFYGRAKVFISRPWMGSCQWPAGYVCFTFSAGSQSTINGCCDCQPNTNCFSQLSSEITFSNLPMGASVTFTAKSCVQGSWQDVPLYAVQSSVQTVYKLWGNTSGNDPCEFGSITFSEQTPPGCAIAEPCDNYTGNPFSLVTNPLNNQLVQNNSICNEEVDRLGFTKPITSRQGSDIFTFSNENVEVCFDRQTQKLHFELNQNPKINILSDICWDKIRDTYTHPNWIEINDISQINDQVIPCSQYWDAVRSINGYYPYPTKLPANPNKAFIFTEILLLHEDSHVKHYNDDYVQYYINLLYNYLEDWDRTCSDFNTISAAQESALDFTELKIIEYNKTLFLQYQWDRGYAFDKNHHNIIPEEIGENWRTLNEQKTHDRKEVRDLIDQYRAAILNLCQH